MYTLDALPDIISLFTHAPRFVPIITGYRPPTWRKLMANFAITGVAGYVAPRHLRAIKETGNQLLLATDPCDSVGILDSFFPDCEFFTAYERFDRHLEKLRQRSAEERIQYLSICSPNYLHDAHIRTALRCGADAICEKPLVLNPWNLDLLKELEGKTGKRIWNILQLRVHPSLIPLKKILTSSPGPHQVQLTYITARGPWYSRSWKGAVEKSGGIATNIGIHLFDMLIWLFGAVDKLEVHAIDDRTCSGALTLEKAQVKWFLSTNEAWIPEDHLAKGHRSYRSIEIDGQAIEFSDGFTNLHSLVYQKTLSGNGFGLEDTRAAIEVTHQIRTQPPIGTNSRSHSLLK
jgi:UDP-N-acetyl-2-amino-2-deoxyglucuronate dehydrogenase